MDPNLSTTNTLLAIMAAVSLLEAIAVVGLIAGGFALYRRTLRLLSAIEDKHVAPTSARVNAILDDVKGVSSAARRAAEDFEMGGRQGLAWLFRRFTGNDQPT